ncbi:hypothetical protein Ciccas_001873 [Cichlidogyrus casuarinus]|uniref:Peptidoglycan binding-like domain-containing protein n=1 Tax=Cichlidogyrus casuarinus TaxID=1844966 RepID=A0ABD2QIU5_9PLAT
MYLLVLVVFVSIHTIDASEIKLRGTEDAMNYLVRFGYLRKDLPLPDADGMSRPPTEYRLAMRKFQKRYGLPVTGRLDSQTRKLMSTPRCGNPDFDVSNSHQFKPEFLYANNDTKQFLRRKKRYNIPDEHLKWSKRLITWQ